MQQQMIAFTTDKNGRPRAYRWSLRLARWFSLGVDEARLKLATGASREVRFISRNPSGL